MKQKIAFEIITGVITFGIISFILITINIGFTNTFLKIWPKSWGMTYFVAISAILLIAPRVEKLVDNLFKVK